MTSASDRRRLALGGALFPLIVASAVLNQERPYVLLMVVGQVVSIACVITTVVLPVVAFPGRLFPVLLAAAVVTLRVARTLVDVQGLTFLYTVTLGIALITSAVLIAVEQPARLRRQMVVFLGWSLVLMVLQVLGVSEWTQILRTDFHSIGEDQLYQYPTLFVTTEMVIPTTLQLRPAGLMASNNLLSVFIVGALAHVLGAPTRGGLQWRHVVLALVTVLAAAKIGLLAAGVFLISMLLAGDWRRKVLALQVTVAFFVALWLHAFFFPGVSELTLSPATWTQNFQYRVTDFLFATGRPELIDLVYEYRLPATVVVQVDGSFGNQSGYGWLAGYLTWILAGVAVLIPLLVLAVSRLRRQRVEWLASGLLMLQAIVLIPVISPFFETNIFWFLLGLALAPIVTALGFRDSPLFDRSDIERIGRRTRADAGAALPVGPGMPDRITG